MAESVNRAMGIVRNCAWAMAVGMATVASAESLPDPTRPPDALSVTGADYAGGQTGPVLQSVLIGPRRAEAIINGQLVRVGDKFGEARVVQISESEVVLRTGKDVRKLKLFPGIEKRLPVVQGNAKSGNRKSKG